MVSAQVDVLLVQGYGEAVEPVFGYGLEGVCGSIFDFVFGLRGEGVVNEKIVLIQPLFCGVDIVGFDVLVFFAEKLSRVVGIGRVWFL